MELLLLGRSLADSLLGGNLAGTLLGRSLTDNLLGGNLAGTLLGRSLADSLLGGNLAGTLLGRSLADSLLGRGLLGRGLLLDNHIPSLGLIVESIGNRERTTVVLRPLEPH